MRLPAYDIYLFLHFNSTHFFSYYFTFNAGWMDLAYILVLSAFADFLVFDSFFFYFSRSTFILFFYFFFGAISYIAAFINT